MATDRVQFSVSPEEGDTIFEILSNVEHAQWIRRPAKAAVWSRIALRVLAAHHAAREAGAQWVIVQGKKVRELEAREPSGVASLRVDLHLHEADVERLHVLERVPVASSPQGVMRMALHLLGTIAARLEKGGQLVARGPGSRSTPIDLALLAEDEGPSAPADAIKLDLQAESSPASDRPLTTERFASPEADEFFSILWCTVTFNRWLTLDIDRVTARAQLTAPRGTRRDEQKAFKNPSRAISLKWQRRLDLRRLLERFWAAEQVRFRRGRSTHLSSELHEQRLLPDSWRQDLTPAEIREKAELGIVALRNYIDSRFDLLHPWRVPAIEAARPGATSPRLPRPILWRHWTHSRNVGPYREVHPPIDWTAVLHHRLSHRPNGRPAMVAHDLQSLITGAFGVRNSRLFLDLAESCARFNQLFYGRAVVSGDHALQESGALVTLPQLLEELARTNANPNAEIPEERWIVAKLTYVFYHVARVLKPVYRWKLGQPGDDRKGRERRRFSEIEVGVRSLAYADLSELRARVFGAQTTISGLHFILHGGIIPRSSRGRVWLIHGRPGSGKSTLGLALAADMASRGRVAIVFCADERADVVAERLVSFGLRDDSRYDVLTSAEFDRLVAAAERDEAPLPAANPDGSIRPVKGLLVIYGAPARMADDSVAGAVAPSEPLEPTEPQRVELLAWFPRVARGARALYHKYCDEERRDPADLPRALALRAHQKLWRWVSVVVDSIDSLEVETPRPLGSAQHAHGQRALMGKLVQTIETCRFWGVLLCGEDNPHLTPLTYLSDTVIEVGIDDTKMHRRLRITKCRMQNYDPGYHDFQIVEGAGIVVHPNLSSVQRAVNRHSRRQLDGTHVIRLPNRIYWPGAPEEQGPEIDRDDELPHIQRGGSVLLYGPPQSGKGPLLLNLMAQRMELPRFPHWQLGAMGAVLVVSLRSSTQDCLRPLVESRALGHKWRRNVSDVQLQWYGADNTLRASQFAYELLRRIQWARRDGIPLDWIAFLGIEALKSNLPAVEAERSFWPTILAITASEEISTAFVVASTDHDFVVQHKQDMDYVLRFGRDETSDARTVEFEKSAEPPPPTGYRKLTLNLGAGTLR